MELLSETVAGRWIPAEDTLHGGDVLWFGREIDPDSGNYKENVWGAMILSQEIKEFQGPRMGKLSVITMPDTPQNREKINQKRHVMFHQHYFNRIKMTDQYREWITKQLLPSIATQTQKAIEK